MLLALVQISKRSSTEEAHEADLVLQEGTSFNRLSFGGNRGLLRFSFMFGQMLGKGRFGGVSFEADVAFGSLGESWVMNGHLQLHL